MIWTLIHMRAHVALEILRSSKFRLADKTPEHLFSFVTAHVLFQILSPVKLLVANST